MANPKLFFSYSWTSPDHEEWVLSLATSLRESGVDVILDKWDLREGHDAHAFMEKMVADPEIKKVILICDKAYAEKADGRSGGVGTEAQIISPEIYSRQDQAKFVAVLKERDENEKPYLPVYYRSRIYIDLSEPSTYSEHFDQLLRWIFDRPLYIKPEIGNIPAFLLENETAITLSTSSRFRRAVDALRNNRGYANAAVEDYFQILATEFEKFRLAHDADPFDEAVVQSIEAFLPYRNEAIEMFLTLALYRDDYESRRALHGFFEKLVPYLERPHYVNTWRDWDFDNFRFLIHELFLYALASLIRYERFNSAASLMCTDFYVEGNSDLDRNVMVPFTVFRKQVSSLTQRNQRLGEGRLSIQADLLHQRCKGVGITFQQLMQADFILFIRDQLEKREEWIRWWPHTLLYVKSAVFEVFGRSRSRSYFDRAKVLLGIDRKEEMEPLLKEFESGKRPLPRWDFESFDPKYLMGFVNISTKA